MFGVNFGIDWDSIVQREEVARLAYVPFIDEAGRLLKAASILWPGRVRAKDLLARSSNCYNLAQHDRLQALGWAGRHNQIGGVLATYCNTSEYSLGDTSFEDAREDIVAGQSTRVEVARRLVSGAIALVNTTVLLLYRADAKKTTSDAGFKNRAMRIEDDFEVFLELPCAQQPLRLLDEHSIFALHRRAVLRECAGLGFSMVMLLRGIDPESQQLSETWARRVGWIDVDSDEPVEPPPRSRSPLGVAAELWSRRRSEWKEEAEKLFEDMAGQDGFTREETDLMRFVRDQSSPYVQKNELTFLNEEIVRKCSEIIEHFLSVFLAPNFLVRDKEDSGHRVLLP